MRRTVWPLLAAVSLLAGASNAATRPRYGGTLRVELRAAVPSLDPAAAAGDAAAKKLVSLVFETLVRLDERGRPQPWLAVHWDVDATKKLWRFTLREARFDDGSALTADAASAALGAANPAWRVRADGSEVVIQTERPAPWLPAELAGLRYGILARAADGKIHGTGPFRVAAFEPNRRIVLEAHEDYWGGRPFLDGVTVELGRAAKERLLDFELGRADLIELRADEARRAGQRGSAIWSSAPLELMALVFERGRPAAEDARVREALALSIDRAAIHSVLLQKHGEPAGGLLPQWLSGYAFLFPAARDAGRARQLAAAAPLKQLVLACDGAEPLARSIADRIALNARDAGLVIRVSTQAGPADLRLVIAGATSATPARALAGLAAGLRLPEPPQLTDDEDLESVYAAEAALLKEHRVIPLFHLPELYAVSPRVERRPAAGSAVSSEWRLEDVWLEADKP